MTSVSEAEMRFGIKPMGTSNTDTYNTPYISTVQSSFHFVDLQDPDKGLFVGNTVDVHFETQ